MVVGGARRKVIVVASQGSADGMIRLIGFLGRRITILRSELDRMDSLIEVATTAIRSGSLVRDIVVRPDMLEGRESLIDALNSVESALMLNRAEGIRIVVDEEGLGVSDVARLIDRPRQLVKRAYDTANERLPKKAVVRPDQT
jgi:hypothetical protein